MKFKKVAMCVICVVCIIGLGAEMQANTKQGSERVVEKKSSPEKVFQENETIQTNQNVNTCEMGHINCDGLHDNIECDVNNANCVGNHAQNECPFNNENGQPIHGGNGHHGKNHKNQSGRRCNW